MRNFRQGYGLSLCPMNSPTAQPALECQTATGVLRELQEHKASRSPNTVDLNSPTPHAQSILLLVPTFRAVAHCSRSLSCWGTMSCQALGAILVMMLPCTILQAVHHGAWRHCACLMMGALLNITGPSVV